MRKVGDLEALVSKKLVAHLYDEMSPWPASLSTQLPDAEGLRRSSFAVMQASEDIEQWAARAGCSVKMVRRDLLPVEVASSVTVPDEAAAERAASLEARTALQRARSRITAGSLEFPSTAKRDLLHALRLVDRFSDVDFELLLEASAWFADNDSCGFTPREVPIPGFSAKWLDGKDGSIRRRAICLLTGLDALQLRERPGEVRYRYLDESGSLERVATVEQLVPERLVDLAIIVENKDTYLGMPGIARAVCVWGQGRASARASTVLPWLEKAPTILYWGDIDADGFEILSAFRESGIACVSVLMDRSTLDRYRRFATDLTPQGKPIPRRVPKDGLSLNSEEYEVYRSVCSGAVRRIEQERIPLSEFVSAARI